MPAFNGSSRAPVAGGRRLAPVPQAPDRAGEHAQGADIVGPARVQILEALAGLAEINLHEGNVDGTGRERIEGFRLQAFGHLQRVQASARRSGVASQRM